MSLKYSYPSRPKHICQNHFPSYADRCASGGVTHCALLCASAAFAHVSIPICSLGICWPAASCQLTVKMSGDDKICFPIHSNSPHAGTALERHQICLRALLCIFTWQRDGASHSFPEGLTFAWLSSAAQARHSCHPLPFIGDWKGVTGHKSPSITPSLYTAQSRFHLQSTAICVSLLHSLPCPSSHHPPCSWNSCT